MPARAVWRSVPLLVTTALFALGQLQYQRFEVGATLAARWYTPLFGMVLGANLCAVLAGSL
jgi:hypothetical protein